MGPYIETQWEKAPGIFFYRSHTWTPFLIDLTPCTHTPPHSCHYGGDAILRHMESTERIIGYLHGLSMIQFEFDYANPHLDTWDPTALHLAGLWTPPRSIKEKSIIGTRSPCEICSVGSS